jgi:transposase-like protein
VFIRIQGELHYLCRPVDQDGIVLDILVQSRYLNNRAENSYRPTRRRERQMQRFKSAWQAQSAAA